MGEGFGRWTAPVAMLGCVVAAVGCSEDSTVFVGRTPAGAARATGALLADGSVVEGVKLTNYTLAQEANLSGQVTGDSSVVCNPPNLSGCYHKEFLCSGYGVAMQGTGIALDGKYVKYVSGGGGWLPGYAWLADCSSAVFAYASGVTGASGRTLVEDYSIAVDPTLIPLGWYVWIEAQGHWYRADDTGGGIAGKHIDIYTGTTGLVPAAPKSTIFVTAQAHAKDDPSPFAPPAPLADAPSNLWPDGWTQVSGTPVVLSWSAVAGASAYEVHVRVFHGGQWRYYRTATAAEPSLALDTSPLPPGSRLAFAVRGTASGEHGPLSRWATFVAGP